MKKPKEEIDDQQWFNDQFKNALTRFDASHGPDVPELQQFEAFVDSHKQETKKKLLKELVGELERDDEQGATSIHLAFDQAALGVMENGSEAVELPYD